jgi:phospho-N-acetylmuramoyl-pentapeptide-transferase
MISQRIIPFLTKLKFGQYVRDDGPQSHLKKTGTPTMGGLIILASMLISSLAFIKGNLDGIVVLFVTLGFGAIGFWDDYIKVVKKRSLGLKPMQKIISQLIITGLFGLYITTCTDIGTDVFIPFSGGFSIHLGTVYIPFLIFTVIGTVNSVNLTDGLDGLASGVTVIVAVFFCIVAWAVGSGTLPIAGAAIGSLMGFLLFNSYPAKVFMGDTGSLALGGFISAMAFLLKMPIFIMIVGIIYVLEALSVIIQVTSFKLTNKRVFKMAPIHHHFELSGWSETKVVSLFYIVTAIACLVGFLAAKNIFL